MLGKTTGRRGVTSQRYIIGLCQAHSTNVVLRGFFQFLEHGENLREFLEFCITHVWLGPQEILWAIKSSKSLPFLSVRTSTPST